VQPLRINYSGAFYHVTCRGNERKKILADGRDRLNAPDRVDDSIGERRNAYKLIDDRLLKVTYVDEAGDIVVITVIEKESVGG
jgi:hypothetical protein